MKKMHKGKSILVVAAHPDDEILGCGGLMAFHTSRGDQVSVLIAAEGITSRDDTRSISGRTDELDDLKSICRRALRTLSVSEVEFGNLPDNRLDSVDLLDIVKLVERTVQSVNPDVVITHHPGDLNVDHRILYEAVLTACRPQPGAGVQKILTMEVPSATGWLGAGVGAGFEPNYFVNLSERGSTGLTHLDAKLAALEVYSSEMRPFPHARSLEAVRALSAWRGASVGYSWAEAFFIVRELIHG